MHGLAGFLEPEVKWQSAKHIKTTARTSDQDVLRFVEFIEEWEFHWIKIPFRSPIPMTACVPELNSKKSFSMPSLKITPFSAMRDSRISGVSGVTRPNTSDVPVVFVGNGSRTV